MSDHDEKTPPMGTRMPDDVPFVRVQSAPFDKYLEIELVVKARDGRERVPTQDGHSAGKIVGRPERRISTSIGYLGSTDRAKLADQLTAFVRHVLDLRALQPVEQTVDELKRGSR